MDDPQTDEVARRLLAYVAEPRSPLTIGALAAALGTDVFRCTRAILGLSDSGHLQVTPLVDDRFRFARPDR